ncbi:hypothetical protein [Paenirhodobacter populi]|uniref:hypothetical protein n=1 Tax=Paenirhodobacter populi TaxID=2306993 RepID=UPI000FE39731|nr:hypothetical protein [Sinirhodobacter populi]RWR09705.1 hypothetical protein D2T32_05005 [Sinirhodobacter populi]
MGFDVDIGITAHDVFLVILGSLVTIPVTGGWNSLKGWITRRGIAAAELKRKWHERLTSSDMEIRQFAFHEVAARSFYFLILGNMWLAIIGAIRSQPFYFGIGSEFISVFLFGAATANFIQSAMWVRKYFRAHNIDI